MLLLLTLNSLLCVLNWLYDAFDWSSMSAENKYHQFIHTFSVNETKLKIWFIKRKHDNHFHPIKAVWNCIYARIGSDWSQHWFTVQLSPNLFTIHWFIHITHVPVRTFTLTRTQPTQSHSQSHSFQSWKRLRHHSRSTYSKCRCENVGVISSIALYLFLCWNTPSVIICLLEPIHSK